MRTVVTLTASTLATSLLYPITSMLLIAQPLLATQVAELVLAPARDVVAPLLLLHHRLALGALPELEVVLEEVHLVLPTRPLVLGEEALPAEHLAALVAPGVRPLLDGQHSVLALLVGTQSLVVLGGLVEGVHLQVLLPQTGAQGGVELPGDVEYFRAQLGGTDHFLEPGDLVFGVLPQTAVAEGVLALADLLPVLVAVLADADLAHELLANGADRTQNI